MENDQFKKGGAIMGVKVNLQALLHLNDQFIDKVKIDLTSILELIDSNDDEILELIFNWVDSKSDILGHFNEQDLVEYVYESDYHVMRDYVLEKENENFVKLAMIEQVYSQYGQNEVISVMEQLKREAI